MLVLFTEDKTVVPKESAWFGSEEVRVDAELSAPEEQVHLTDTSIIPMRLQPLYIEDWIGLRALDERGGVIFESCEGEHMRLGDCWKKLVSKYVGDKI